MNLIGIMQDHPKVCGVEHLPGCFNPDLDQTWCLCGGVKWSGNKGTWVSRRMYDSPSAGAALLGYDVYYLPPVGA